MTEWSKGMAAKLRRRKWEVERRDAKFIELQRLREDEGPRLWQEVQNLISQEGNALCAEMEEDFLAAKSDSPTEMTVTADMTEGPRTCKVIFYPLPGKLTWKRENGSNGTFELAVGKNGKLWFFSGDEPLSLHHIAERILEALLLG
jgi:hypothetical protein